MHRLQVLKRQFIEARALLIRQRHQRAGDVVRLPERQAQRPHQPVGQIGRGQVPLEAGRTHGLAVRLEISDQPDGGGERQLDRVGGEEGHLFVFLHILGVGQRQALHGQQQAGEGPENPPDLGAQQLGRVRVALLRHDRRAS